MAKTLHYGDNLDVLRNAVGTETVDLIYLYPPFNSAVNYNVIFKEHKTGAPQAQIAAFEDTWQWGEESVQALFELETRNGELAELMYFLVKLLGKNSLSAYLAMMAVRVVELHRVLKSTGSFYLHCDPTASHYLKLILDVVFGAQRFRSEITWKRSSAHSDAKQGRKAFGNVADTLLYYTKGEAFTFRTLHTSYDEDYARKFYRFRDADGRQYRLSDMTGPGGVGRGNPSYEVMGVTRSWRYSRESMAKLIAQGRVVQTKPGNVPQQKRYLDEMPGVPLQNIWDDIPPVAPSAKERLGYPTQKPLALLERIIQTSSNPGDIVMDPFCGCGTAVAAAEKLGRDWIGIDVTHLAISLIQARLRRDHGLESGKDYALEGTPEDLASARYLFESTPQGPYQFQFWALGLIGAQPYGAGYAGGKGKKGADTGIDGKLFFRTPNGEKLESVIVSVKGGKNLNPGMVRDLKGTVEREKAALGVFITLEEPTSKMLSEAACSEPYRYGRETLPKIQILTVRELLAGARPKVPLGAANVSLEQKAVQTSERVAARRNQGPLFTEQ